LLERIDPDIPDMSCRALLIGLDGAAYDVLKPLIDHGHMPFLGRLLAAGASAPLRGVAPDASSAAWTALTTGRRPAQQVDVDDSLNANSGESSPTIWELAAAGGLRVTALNFPGMSPPPKLAGFIVSDHVPRRQPPVECWPEGLLEDVPVPSERDQDPEPQSGGASPTEDELAAWLEVQIRRERDWLDTFQRLHRRRPSGLTAMRLDGIGKVQLACGAFLEPRAETPLPVGREGKIRALCLGFYEELDRILGALCEEVGDEATIVIASHGGSRPKGGRHRPLGMLGVKGRDIRPGARAAELSILDATPTLLHAAGLPIPDELEGELPAELYREQAPPQPAEPRHAGKREPARMLKEEDERAIMEKMRQLGYLE